jgi:chaperonin cofactor prefoldin
MTKELIEARIQDLIAKGKELEQTAHQTAVQLQQINGALQQCQWFLSELEKQNAPTEVQN